MRAGQICLALLLSAVYAGSFAASDAAEQFMVEMEVWIDGEQRGTPIVVVEPGIPASVEVGDPSGEAGWRVEVLVEPPASPRGSAGANIWLQLAVYTRSAGEWSLLGDSLLGVPEGQASVFSVVEAGQAQDPSPATSLVHVSARASHLLPAARPD